MKQALRWLRFAFFGLPPLPVLEEASYPRDAMGRFDLNYFTKPASEYISYVDEYLASLDTPLPSGFVERKRALQLARHAYSKGVLGAWGLNARGSREALPYVLGLLTHRLPEAREIAAGIIASWSKDESGFSSHVFAAAEREAASDNRDPETLSTLLEILGRLKTPEALPLLARVLRAPWARAGDVDHSAAEAIGLFAGQRFSGANAIEAAKEWLRARGT